MKYHNITHDDMLNGEGLRVVLWVSGCSHHCEGCHNPITWNPDYGKEFTKSELLEIFNELDKDYISGLTLSGGDPLHENNVSVIYNLIQSVRYKYNNTKDIWLYTGYKYDEIFNNDENPANELRRKIVTLCDVIVDGKFIKELSDTKYHWAGSKNQNVIRIKS